jgi:hypothetical protein
VREETRAGRAVPNGGFLGCFMDMDLSPTRSKVFQGFEAEFVKTGMLSQSSPVVTLSG